MSTTNDKRIVVHGNRIYMDSVSKGVSFVPTNNGGTALDVHRLLTTTEDIDDTIALLTAAKAEMARREAGR